MRLEGVRAFSTAFGATDLVDLRPGVVSTLPTSEIVSSLGTWIVWDLSDRDGVAGNGVLSLGSCLSASTGLFSTIRLCTGLTFSDDSLDTVFRRPRPGVLATTGELGTDAARSASISDILALVGVLTTGTCS